VLSATSSAYLLLLVLYVCVCRGLVFRVHSFDYKGQVVWGLTAAILIQVAQLALGRPPDFEVEHPSNAGGTNQSRM
jgi:hypothetical protein